jgi:2-methylaconitate cis-trans-isomerase PrpF
VPKIGFVAPPAAATTLTGEAIAASEMDLTGRMVSMGNVHRALPLTGVLGFAVAAQIEGTLVHRATRKRGDSALLRLAHPSGIVEAAADVSRTPHGWQAAMASVRRTQRRLFDGYVYVPASRVPALSTAMDSAAD